MTGNLDNDMVKPKCTKDNCSLDEYEEVDGYV